MTLRIAILLLALGAGGAAAGAWRAGAAREAAREAAAETSRIRAWARSESGGGISLVPKKVPAADGRRLRHLQQLPGFHEYAMRCSSCHALPDPGAYPARRWAGRVDAMRRHIDRAGVMPPPDGELAAVVGFLRAASDSVRSSAGRE